MKKYLIILAVIAALFVTATIGGSFYMLNYSLAPDETRLDTASRMQQLVEGHPEVAPWLDSLKACGALRDTFVIMPSGERHHAYYVRRDSCRRMAVVIHGWRDCAIDFFYIARIYNGLMGYSVLMPDLHAHGLSEGDAIGMGWKDRHDVLHWIALGSQLFGADSLVVHGVSMGAATTMNVSGESMPEGIADVKFVEDCGYSSVWDEFSHELDDDFSLPEFPLMYTTSLLCKLKYGWSFGEASPLKQLRKCRHPMLFIHGDADDFVPTHMVHPLYETKGGEKDLWLTKGTAHARSYADYPEEYHQRLEDFLE